MGSCVSKPRIREELMYDDYYGSDDNWYHGDQSWQYFRAQDTSEFYESEFQPEPPKRSKSKGSAIRSKIQSIRNSFFNQGTTLSQTPQLVRRESKGGIKGKLNSWRRSWFGPEPSPRPQRKLSLSQILFGSKDEPVVKRDKTQGLSQSGLNRLNVTRSFVEKHGKPEEVYRNIDKSPISSRKCSSAENESMQISPTGRQIETNAIVASKPSQPQHDIEDEISEFKIHSRQAEREFLAKIKEIGSMDYCSDSDEDVSKLNEEFNQNIKNLEEDFDRKDASSFEGMDRNENEGQDSDVFDPKINDTQSEIEASPGNAMEENAVEVENLVDEKYQEGIALFNEKSSSEDDEEASDKEVWRHNSSTVAQNGTEFSTDEEPEAKTSPKRGISVNSSVRSQGSTGTRIQISSKGRI